MTQSVATPDIEIPRRDSRLWPFLFALFVSGWLAVFFQHPDMLTKIGVGHYRIEVAPQRFQEVWFLDTRAILAANDAVTAGADPYARNSLDYFHRPHVYGPVWLYLRHFGLTRFHTLMVGVALIMAFLVAVLLFLRPRCPRCLLWYIAIFCTTPVLAAIERGNNDLVIFLILMPLVPCLLSKHHLVRWLALPVIALAAALKYYPATAALLLLAIAGGPRETRWRLGAVAVALALVGWHVAANVPTFGLLPAPAGVLSFGASGVFRELGIQGIGPRVVAIGITFGAVCLWWRSPGLREWRPNPSMQREWQYFVLGSVLLSGCFWVSQNFAYRWIFAIWMAPFLWLLPRDLKTPAVVTKLARVTAWLLLVMLWGEAVLVFTLSRWGPDVLGPALHWIFLGMQPFTWAFFLCVLGFLTKFIRDGLSDLLAEKTLLHQPKHTAEKYLFVQSDTVHRE
jgi:hypothetical protein